MSDAVLSALVQGGATAVLLGIMLMIVIPRMLKFFGERLESAEKSHADEMAAHSKSMGELTEQVGKLAASVDRIADEQRISNDRWHQVMEWTREQTSALTDLARTLNAASQPIRPRVRVLPVTPDDEGGGSSRGGT